MAEEFSRQKDYHVARFRGFKFLMESENTSGGQEVALHEYPNRNDRFAEPMGEIPKILGMTCVIHGENYFQLRLDFERVLNTPGVSELIHPFYGAIDVQPGPFVVTTNQREIGKFTFNVTFYTSVDGIGPAPIGFSSSTMSLFANDARFALGNALEGSYLDPEDGFDLGKAVDAALGALDAVQDGIDSVIGPLESAIATVSSTINEFRAKIFRIAQTGTRIKDAFANLYNDMLQLTLDPATLTTMWQDLINFGTETTTAEGRPGPPNTSSPIGPTDTVKRNRNETNKSLIDEQARITGLIGLMESLAFTEFTTADELTVSVAVTDERFSSYFQENEQESETGVPSLAFNNDVRVSVLQLRAGLKNVLDAQLANIWRTVTERPGRSSMALTAYRYYGDHETLENIIELNPGVNAANFSKEITLVTK